MCSIFARLVPLLILTAMITACGGRTAHPVITKQLEDEGKSCEILSSEIRQTEYKITELREEKYDVIRSNILKGVFGGFTLGISLLFLDVSGASQTELTAMNERNAHLQELFSAKCRKGGS